MDLPIALTQAAQAGRLLVLWGALPFPLAERPPANRALALSRLPAAPVLPAVWQEGVPGLPPLPILSLDASDRLERAFAAAGVPLQVVRGHSDVPAAGRHNLLNLAGDLPTRSGLVLSRAELRDLRGQADKRHLLDEARRLVAGGALLLLGNDPADKDFRAWWAALLPIFRGAALFAVGEPSAPWPAGVACLGPDLAAVGDALRAAQPPPAAVPPADSRPPLTGTAHTLPFDKLSPRNFERLCLWLVEAEGYQNAEHLGAAGSEQGRDLVAWREGVQWAFQCKRVRSFGPGDAVREVDKVLGLSREKRPAGLIFLVTCDVSAKARQQARDRCAGAGLACHFWTGTELDRRVKRHDDIVAEFFAAGAPAA